MANKCFSGPMHGALVSVLPFEDATLGAGGSLRQQCQLRRHLATMPGSSLRPWPELGSADASRTANRVQRFRGVGERLSFAFAALLQRTHVNPSQCRILPPAGRILPPAGRILPLAGRILPLASKLLSGKVSIEYGVRHPGLGRNGSSSRFVLGQRRGPILGSTPAR